MSERRRRATSADVAARAGVSRTTVSFVLNGKADAGIPPGTRRRIEEAARELGYHPHGAARALAGGHRTPSASSCASRPSRSPPTPFSPRRSGALRLSTDRGYRVLVEPLSPDGGRYSDLLLSQQVDGLIVSGPRVDDEELAALVAEGFPIILQGSLPDVAAPSVDIDNRAGARPRSST